DGITTDSDGQIVYVSDRQNKRIQIFDSEGNYLTQLESLGTLAGQFGKPRDVAVDLLNRIYVVDKDNNNIQVFAPGKGTQSVQSVNEKDNEDEEGGVQKAFTTDPNSPTRHGKSYFTETFESEEDDPV